MPVVLIYRSGSQGLHRLLQLVTLSEAEVISFDQLAADHEFHSQATFVPVFDGGVVYLILLVNQAESWSVFVISCVKTEQELTLLLSTPAISSPRAKIVEAITCFTRKYPHAAIVFPGVPRMCKEKTSAFHILGHMESLIKVIVRNKFRGENVLTKDTVLKQQWSVKMQQSICLDFEASILDISLNRLNCYGEKWIRTKLRRRRSADGVGHANESAIAMERRLVQDPRTLSPLSGMMDMVSIGFKRHV